MHPGLWKVIAADDGTDVNRYIHDPVMGHILQHEDPSGDWNYPAGDALGTVRSMYDEGLTPVYTAERDPYGVLINSSGANPTPYEYTGEMRDTNGLQYHRARYLDTSLGVWISEDPLETPNRYAYVGGDPVNATDPSGNAPACQSGNPTDSIPMKEFRYDGNRAARYAIRASTRNYASPPTNGVGGGFSYQGLSGNIGGTSSALFRTFSTSISKNLELTSWGVLKTKRKRFGLLSGRDPVIFAVLVSPFAFFWH